MLVSHMLYRISQSSKAHRTKWCQWWVTNWQWEWVPQDRTRNSKTFLSVSRRSGASHYKVTTCSGTQVRPRSRYITTMQRFILKHWKKLSLEDCICCWLAQIFKLYFNYVNVIIKRIIINVSQCWTILRHCMTRDAASPVAMVTFSATSPWDKLFTASVAELTIVTLITTGRNGCKFNHHQWRK